MTRLFRDDGRVVPVTVLEARPCPVVLVRTVERDGYEAVQIGYRAKRKDRLTKPELGHLDKAGAPPVACLAEIPLPEGREVKPGDFLEVSMFVPGEKVNVTGLTKGKGFQGVVKRHGFSGGPGGHGSMMHRRSGSIGNRTWPARVFKNTRMGGHMGHVRVTVQNLKVVQVRNEDNVILVRGAIPGPTGSVLIVRKALKKPSKAAKKS